MALAFFVTSPEIVSLGGGQLGHSLRDGILSDVIPPDRLVDKCLLDRTDCLQELIHVLGALFHLRMESMHDRSGQAWIDPRTSLAKIRGKGGIVMQGGPPVEDFALPGMLE